MYVKACHICFLGNKITVCITYRDSEAIIPNIFFFLVLLSYERYHSKQIISIPKIIQLCDGIMASGRKAVTHGERNAYDLYNF